MAVDQVVNEDDEDNSTPPVKKSGFGKLLLIASLVLVLLVGGGIGAAVMLLDQETIEELPLVGSVLSGLAGSGNSDDRPRPPIYVELGDAFVVNFIEGNQIRYLQVRIEVMTRDPDVPAAIANHLPRIRHNLVFMFSGFEYVALASIDGKKEVRDRTLQEIQSVLLEETGQRGIEDVYFTSFVMQ